MRRRGPVPVALCLHNLRGIVQIDENRVKEDFVRSGGIVNWWVNFSSNLKSRAARVVGRESLPNYILKKIDICKLSFVTQSQ